MNSTYKTIGILHPGVMGTSIAASAAKNEHTVYWTSQGRSQDTRARAEKYGLVDAGTLENLCAQSELILSVCPPHAAEVVARDVIAAGFLGTYCDANAISPQRAQHISEVLNAAGISFVDGGIIGGPAWKRGETWLYLSGPQAEKIADCFRKGPLETQIIGTEIGKASALKMCYAAFTKGTTALLCASLGAAEGLKVRDELMAQWARDDSGSSAKNEKRVLVVTQKAWRFEGEMYEIADTFDAVGIPANFHRAAAEVYHRLASFKDDTDLPTLDAVLAQLLNHEPSPDHS